MSIKEEKNNKKTSIFKRLVLLSVMFTALPVVIVGALITFSYQQVITQYLLNQENEVIKQAGEEIFLALQSVSIQAVLTLLIVIILSLFGSIVMARNLVKPIKKVLAGIERVGRGDFNFEVKVKSEDEIGELSERFNEMMEKLKNQSALEDSKTVLEIKVKAKTRELEEMNKGLEYKIKERTKDLQRRLRELEKFRTVTVGRELKMIELKKQNEKLEKNIKELEEEIKRIKQKNKEQ